MSLCFCLPSALLLDQSMRAASQQSGSHWPRAAGVESPGWGQGGLHRSSMVLSSRQTPLSDEWEYFLSPRLQRQLWSQHLAHGECSVNPGWDQSKQEQLLYPFTQKTLGSPGGATGCLMKVTLDPEGIFCSGLKRQLACMRLCCASWLFSQDTCQNPGEHLEHTPGPPARL